MMKETGVVVDIRSDSVDVATALKTSCSSCSAKKSCGTSALAEIWNDKENIIQIPYSNTNALQLGQHVEISVDELGVLLSALLVYLLPIFIFFLGFASVSQLFQTNAHIPWVAILVGFLSAATSLFSVRKYLKSTHCKLKPNVKINKVIPAEIPTKAIT